MTNCSITDDLNPIDRGIYALWIAADAGNVSLNNVKITCDRGIAIKDEYVTKNEEVNNRKQIVLSLTNCKFETSKKAAVLVTNTEGAVITASNCDITNVAADSTNLVWLDPDPGYGEGIRNVVSVNGTGDSIIVEP